MSYARALFAAALVVALSGCPSTPVNAAGSYTVNLTNGANGCMFGNWTEGSTTSGVQLRITQTGSSLTATVEGGTAAVFDVLFGSHIMTGSVSGNHLDLVIHGTNQTTPVGTSCTMSLDAHASVDLSGDALQNGTITYTIVTNHDSTCPIYTQSCETSQAFNGTRPPSI